MQKLFLVVITFSLFNNARSQPRDTSQTISFERTLCLLAGINYNKHAYIDVGISFNKVGVVGYHPMAIAYFIASEVHLIDKPVLGPKVGIWAAGGVAPLAIGLNMIYYSDFTEDALVFRPEIGFGVGRLKITYGRNVKTTHAPFDQISKNTFGLTYCFNLIKK